MNGFVNNILLIGLSRIVKKRVLKAIASINEIENWECATVSQQEDAKKLGAHKVYSNYDDALKNTKAQWVYISLPNSLHEKWIRAALNSNKNVIVDKPAVIDLVVGYELLALARAKGLILTEAMTFGFHNQFSFAKSLYEKLGSRIQNVHACFTIPALSESDFRSNPNLGGGAFWDMASYSTGVGRVLFNELPVSLDVLVQGSLKNMSKINNFSILAQYRSGEKVTGHFGFGFEYANTISLSGRDLNIELYRPFSLAESMDAELKGFSKNLEVKYTVKADDSFVNYLCWVIKLTQNEQKEMIWNNFEEGLRATEILCSNIKNKERM